MRKISVLRRGVLVAVLASLALFPTAPAEAVLFTHTAHGVGTDGLGNRLAILSVDNAFLGGIGLASVRLVNDGRATLVLLTCVTFDERPGDGFHFLYASGLGLNTVPYYIGVFDDAGLGRTGPYDAMYTQTNAVNGPCNVAAVNSYPIGWDPVSTGDFVVI